MTRGSTKLELGAARRLFEKGMRVAWIAASILLLAQLPLKPAAAQTASQIAAPSFNPLVRTEAGVVVIPESQKAEVPAGADKLTVRVGRLRVIGAISGSATRTAALEARLTNRRVTVAEIFAAARELERIYGEAGLALVRVVLPPQRLIDGGDVQVVVVDGFIERIDVSALPHEVQARIEQILAPLIGAHEVSSSLIERKLLLASDTPGTVLRSTLAPGVNPGASVLIIEGRYKAVTGSLSVDNTVSRALGRDTYSAGFEFNSPTGQGETLYFRGLGLPSTGGYTNFFSSEPRNRSLATGLLLPLGDNGLNLALEATNGRATARITPGTVGFTSDFSRFSARLRYPLIRNRTFALFGEAVAEGQEEHVDVRLPVAAPYSYDRLRITRTAAEFSWYLPTEGLLTGRITGSYGLEGLGAREPPPAGSSEIPLSRQGARPEFQKLDAALTFTQPLAEHLTLDLRARGQTSFNQALVRSEQIGLASSTGLSSFDVGLFQGDEGYVARAEAQFPYTLPAGIFSMPVQQGASIPPSDAPSVGLVLTPYGFGAFGLVRQQNPTALEHANVRGDVYGIGLRLTAAPTDSFTNFACALEYGRADRSDSPSANHRLTFTLSLQF